MKGQEKSNKVESVIFEAHLLCPIRRTDTCTLLISQNGRREN